MAGRGSPEYRLPAGLAHVALRRRRRGFRMAGGYRGGGDAIGGPRPHIDRAVHRDVVGGNHVASMGAGGSGESCPAGGRSQEGLELPITRQLAAIFERRRAPIARKGKGFRRDGYSRPGRAGPGICGTCSIFITRSGGPQARNSGSATCATVSYRWRRGVAAAALVDQAAGEPRRSDDVTEGYAANWTATSRAQHSGSRIGSTS